MCSCKIFNIIGILFAIAILCNFIYLLYGPFSTIFDFDTDLKFDGLFWFSIFFFFVLFFLKKHIQIGSGGSSLKYERLRSHLTDISSRSTRRKELYDSVNQQNKILDEFGKRHERLSERLLELSALAHPLHANIDEALLKLDNQALLIDTNEEKLQQLLDRGKNNNKQTQKQPKTTSTTTTTITTNTKIISSGSKNSSTIVEPTTKPNDVDSKLKFRSQEKPAEKYVYI